jgi:hypothetical protein
MCLACEQDAIWLSYLDSQGLLKPDDPAGVDALFSAFPVQTLPLQRQPEWDAPTPEAPAKAAPNPFSCDDPTDRAVDLKSLQPGRELK